MTCKSMFIKSVFLYMHTKLIHKRRNVINKNATKTGASQMFFYWCSPKNKYDWNCLSVRLELSESQRFHRF